MTRLLILCAIYYQAVVHGVDPQINRRKHETI